MHLGQPPVRIDVSITISDVTWKQADGNADPGGCDNIKVRFLGKTEIFANKKARGRPQDQTDIEALESELFTTLLILVSQLRSHPLPRDFGQGKCREILRFFWLTQNR